MPQIINTNIASLNAQRNLNRTQGQLNVALQRISSGLRINSAKDDAAGLAITDRMTAQIRGLNQAARNASDAISLVQTGEGALQEVTNSLQRMRELAVQSRNATNTASDRQSLNDEFQQLSQEIDRIAQTTSFNGQKILDGTLGSVVFQVGANVGETISVDVGSSMRTSAIGNFASVSYQLGNVLNGTADNLLMDAAGDIVINTVSIDAANAGANGLGQGSAQSIVNAINAKTDGSSGHGVTAVAGTTSASATAAQIAAFAFTNNDGAGDLTYTLSINGTQVFTQGQADTLKTADQLAASINQVKSTTGVTASVQSDGSVDLSTTDGRNIEISEVLGGEDNAADQVLGYFGNTATNAADTQVDVYKANISLSSSSAIDVTVAVAADDLFQGGTGGTGPDDDGSAVNTAVTGLDTTDVLSGTNADLAIQRIDVAITDVDVLRGTLGAVQSRFDSTVASLQNAAENVSAARSRIKDADFAAETAELTRTQILQQAGIAILAQANALPQNALALLQ